MARNDPQMNLRVPVELKEKVEKAAFENGRTITAEAVYRLEQSFNSTQENIELIRMMGDLMARLESLEKNTKG